MSNSTIGARIRRFLPAELRRARLSLTKATGNGSSAAPIHEARKSIKKLRALLRLVEKSADKRLVEGASIPLRETAHRLGPLRDHLVLTKTVRDLRRRAEPEPEPPAAPDAVPLLRMARIHLRHGESGLLRLLKSGLDDDAIPAGLRRLYRRAREALRQAEKSGSNEDLHAARRRAKDLLYALDVMGSLPRWRERLKKLTELLGDDHDLAGFTVHYGSDTARDQPKVLLKRAKKRRRALQKKALRLGGELLGEKPRAFVERALH